MVDMLGRARRLDEAMRLMESMTVEPDPAVWCLCWERVGLTLSWIWQNLLERKSKKFNRRFF
ncbi:hypothetical protein Bca52824_075965 [Brassica carinata]|uniref:Pentatricopeptide repeat-containing protein n=1 Tax=Brassica carinata TaxID=52824 RepID=A0A8X7TYK4_BRACI|nr:hypothetical protein Bca52824_075965 [Brassica carinata]